MSVTSSEDQGSPANGGRGHLGPVRVAWSRARRWLSVRDDDLRNAEISAREREQPLLLGVDTKPLDDLDTTVEIVREVVQGEAARETNLNGRGTAVASVAALLVSVSGAVAKSLFERPAGESGVEFDLRAVALVLFALALAAVAAAMGMAVLGVLRPARGPTTRWFLGETISDLWTRGHASPLVAADRERVQLLYLDRALRTLPEWHFRNRRKARWLRRSYVILGIGIVLVGAAGIFAAADTGDFPLSLSLPTVAVGLALVWIAIRFDLVGARRGVDDEEPKEEVKVPERDDIDEIARLLEKPFPRSWHVRKKSRPGGISS